LNDCIPWCICSACYACAGCALLHQRMLGDLRGRVVDRCRARAWRNRTRTPGARQRPVCSVTSCSLRTRRRQGTRCRAGAAWWKHRCAPRACPRRRPRPRWRPSAPRTTATPGCRRACLRWTGRSRSGSPTLCGAPFWFLTDKATLLPRTAAPGSPCAAPVPSRRHLQTAPVTRRASLGRLFLSLSELKPVVTADLLEATLWR